MESSEPRSTVFLMQAIGKAAKRGNTTSVLETVCKGQHLEEIYYLSAIVFSLYLFVLNSDVQ